MRLLSDDTATRAQGKYRGGDGKNWPIVARYTMWGFFGIITVIPLAIAMRAIWMIPAGAGVGLVGQFIATGVSVVVIPLVCALISRSVAPHITETRGFKYLLQVLILNVQSRRPTPDTGPATTSPADVFTPAPAATVTTSPAGPFAG